MSSVYRCSGCSECLIASLGSGRYRSKRRKKQQHKRNGANILFHPATPSLPVFSVSFYQGKYTKKYIKSHAHDDLY